MRVDFVTPPRPLVAASHRAIYNAAISNTLGYHWVKSCFGLWLPGDDRGHWSEAWDDQIGFIEPHTLHDGDPGYMSLWPLGDIARLNEDYNVAAFAPGFLCFGSNGGGELLAFDAAGRICHLPAIGMDAKCAIRIADSWLEFERFIQEPA